MPECPCPCPRRCPSAKTPNGHTYKRRTFRRPLPLTTRQVHGSGYKMSRSPSIVYDYDCVLYRPYTYIHMCTHIESCMQEGLCYVYALNFNGHVFKNAGLVTHLTVGQIYKKNIYKVTYFI